MTPRKDPRRFLRLEDAKRWGGVIAIYLCKKKVIDKTPKSEVIFLDGYLYVGVSSDLNNGTLMFGSRVALFSGKSDFGEVSDFFYTTQEMRKLKLEKINDSNR